MSGGGYYSAAKAALEGVSGALRKELEPLGVHLMVFEPGSFRTEFRGRSARGSKIRIHDYDEILGRSVKPRLGPQRGDPDTTAYPSSVTRRIVTPEPETSTFSCGTQRRSASIAGTTR